VTGIRSIGPGLDAIKAHVEDLGDVETYLPAAADAVREYLRATTSAGTSPSGKPWAPRKKDGGKPLQNAFAAIDVRAVGKDVIVELEGEEVFHQYGAGAAPVREIIPKEVDEKLGNAIARGVVKPFKERA
jgi:hypothetical protein